MKVKWFLTFILFTLYLTSIIKASSMTTSSLYVNPEGLIAYYPFDQCTGTSATDRGDWGNTGTLITSPTWVAGKYGCGLNFATGGNSYVNASNNSILNPSAITISIWVYRTGDDSSIATYTIIAKNNGGATPYYGIGLYSATNVYATANANPVLSYGTEANVIPKNTWVYLAMTEDGSTLKTYVNGVLYNSSSSSMTATSTTNLWIGGGSTAFQGVLDEVKIWNRALSAEEVYVDYLGTYANIEKYYQGLTTNNITAVGTNLTNAQAYILGNMSNNFTATNLLITYLNGNVSSNFTHTNGLISNVLGNQTLILGNQTLILGNESTIITNIANLNGSMSANFTYTNGQIALVLGNQTLILGNETLILTNLANVNATQNANYANLEALITSLSNLTAQEVWEYFNRTVNCSNCGSSLTAAEVWTYVSRTLTDYNLTGVLSYLDDINNTQVLILGNQSLILGNESVIITNIANLNGNMSANFTYIEGQLTLVLGNQTFILGNETLILTNVATLEANMSGNFTYTNSLINNLNCSGGNGTGTFYYLNQTVQANSNVSGMQQWLNFQILLLIMAVAFLGFGIWRHNNPMISMGSIILILLALSIYSDGINAGVSNVTQNGNYTYNGYSQLTNITSSDTYSYKTWKDATSNGIALLLAVFGSGIFIYSALYTPYSNRGRK